MFTVKLKQENSDQELQQVWQCERYDKTLRAEQHFLTLYGVVGLENEFHIDLKEVPEDSGGKYQREVFIMNESGQTIDRI